MWRRQVAGKTLTFRLAGINNQNFLMRDEETGSFWQQISGVAVSGPMKGQQLELVPCDELTFGLWKKENPAGLVLRPVAEFAKEYEPADWDVKMAKAKTVVDTKGTGLEPRALVLGLEVEGSSRAFPVELVKKAKLVASRVGAVPVILVLGPDGESIRTFKAVVPGVGRESDFYVAMGNGESYFIDSLTGGRWNFQGCNEEGKCLEQLYPVKDYWFDWRLYHPKTTVERVR